ncbi:Hsp90 co-chaperone Cdc37, partial [Galemys pyrenaicus]
NKSSAPPLPLEWGQAGLSRQDGGLDSMWECSKGSDDEDEMHPNIDMVSLFHWHRQNWVESMEQFQKEEELDRDCCDYKCWCPRANPNEKSWAWLRLSVARHSSCAKRRGAGRRNWKRRARRSRACSGMWTHSGKVASARRWSEATPATHLSDNVHLVCGEMANDLVIWDTDRDMQAVHQIVTWFIPAGLEPAEAVQPGPGSKNETPLSLQLESHQAK